MMSLISEEAILAFSAFKIAPYKTVFTLSVNLD